MLKFLRTTAVIAISLFTVACAHKPEAKAVAAPVGDGDGDGARAAVALASSGASAASAGKRCDGDGDCGDKQLCIRSLCTDITPDLAECSSFRIHFDFDSSVIADSERAKLEMMARCLKADRGLHVTVEGNADERGTDEYNMSLGDKRATDVATYLGRLGVTQTQLKTVSFGSEKPVCTTMDEDCLAQNRRAAVKPTTGGKKK